MTNVLDGLRANAAATISDFQTLGKQTNVLDGLRAAAAATPLIVTESDRLPTIGWRNGNKVAGTPGFFYIKADAIAAPPVGDQWRAATIYGDESGFVAETLNVVPLGLRRQAFTEEKVPGQKYATRTWYPRWEKGMRLYTEMLVRVEGLDGVWIWGMKGMTGKAMTGGGGVLDQHKALVKSVSVAIGAALNPWALWMPITTARTDKKKIIYADTGFNSVVTPPAFVFDPDDDVTLIAAERFIGPEAYAAATALHQEYAALGWSKQQRSNGDEDGHQIVNEETGEVFDAPRSSRQSQPTPPHGDDDMPF